jgi:glycosyltransferase involved in cell wall biosynthesis
MKILFINKFFFLNGGSETVLFQERDFMMNHGHEVVDFSMAHPKNLPSDHSNFFVPNVDYKDATQSRSLASIVGSVKTALNFVYSREAIARLQALIEREKPQIAHLHNIYHQLTPAIIPVLKTAGVKVVLTLHDYKLLCPSYLMLNNYNICNECHGKRYWQATINRCSGGSWLESALLTIEAYFHKTARSYEAVDLFLSPSEFLAGLLRNHRLDSQKVEVLHNGVAVEKFSVSEKDHEYAIYFGRLSKEKGIETLLKAYELMLKARGQSSDSKMGMKIIGTGILEGRLRDDYPHVEFLGYRTGAELRDLVEGSSFVVVPSQWYENCSMSVLEAMAYGKPVIAARIGGLPEQVEDERTGLLFEAGNAEELSDKMARLVSSRGLRIQMGKSAREKLEREYDLDAHCVRLLSLYERIL